MSTKQRDVGRNDQIHPRRLAKGRRAMVQIERLKEEEAKASETIFQNAIFKVAVDVVKPIVFAQGLPELRLVGVRRDGDSPRASSTKRSSTTSSRWPKQRSICFRSRRCQWCSRRRTRSRRCQWRNRRRTRSRRSQWHSRQAKAKPTTKAQPVAQAVPVVATYGAGTASGASTASGGATTAQPAGGAAEASGAPGGAGASAGAQTDAEAAETPSRTHHYDTRQEFTLGDANAKMSGWNRPPWISRPPN